MNKVTLITSPSTNFDSVSALMKCRDLNDDEKISALLNWKATCELEQASTDEGMPGDHETKLGQINKALEELEYH